MSSTTTFSPPASRRSSTTTTTSNSRHNLPPSIHHSFYHNFRHFDLIRNNDSPDGDIVLGDYPEAPYAERDSWGQHDGKYTPVTQFGGHSLGLEPHSVAMSVIHNVASPVPNLVASSHSTHGTVSSFDTRSWEGREDFITVDDVDYHMQEGGTASDFPIFDDEEEISSSDDESNHVPYTDMTSGSQTISLPSNIPFYLQLPQPQNYTATMLEQGEFDPGANTAEQWAHIQTEEEDDDFDELIQTHPMALSHPNAVALAPENHDVVTFLRHWMLPQHEFVSPGAAHRARSAILKVAQEEVKRIECKDLAGDRCDLQGIDWSSFPVTREAARRRRQETYINYVNQNGSDEHNVSALAFHCASPYPKRHADRSPCHQPIQHVDNDSNFFRFRGMNLKRDVRLLHFQLRNILGCSSQSRAFYPSTRSVREINPENGSTKIAMSLSHDTDAQISTMTATQELLLVGGFFGDYRYKCLDTDDSAIAVGRLTDHPSGITNHVQVYNDRRSSRPLAAFASNDSGFRVVDLSTNQLISEQMHECIINCTSMSPDKRLRVVVGDHQDAFITDAETGQVLQHLEGHSDFGFACDWAPDGWTVATGNQDRTIRVWDARYWRRPVAVMPTQLSGARSLRFSPLGSGKRVLAAAEEADYINIIDGQNFMHKQTFDMFGEIGGIEFTNGGSDLLALSSDYYRGGLLQLRRCDAGAEDTVSYEDGAQRRYDWLSTTEGVLQRPDSDETLTQRRRQAFLTTSDFAPL